MTFYVVEESALDALTGGPRHKELIEAVREFEALNKSVVVDTTFSVYEVNVSRIHPIERKPKSTEN